MKEDTYQEIKRRIKYNVSLRGTDYLLDDLINDTIMKLLNKNNDSKSCVKQCIKTAKHLVIDSYRKQRKFKNIYDKEPEKLDIQFIDLDFEIPKEYKELYILRFKFKMKYKEISDFTGVKMGTLKPRISKMIREIKRVNGL